MNEEQLQKYEKMAHYEYIDEYGSPSVAQAVRDLVAEVRLLLSSLDRPVITTDKGVITLTSEYKYKCSICGRRGLYSDNNLAIAGLENHPCPGPFIFVKIAKDGPWHLAIDGATSCRNYEYKTVFESKEVPRPEGRKFMFGPEYTCKKCSNSWRFGRA